MAKKNTIESIFERSEADAGKIFSNKNIRTAELLYAIRDGDGGNVREKMEDLQTFLKTFTESLREKLTKNVTDRSFYLNGAEYREPAKAFYEQSSASIKIIQILSDGFADLERNIIQPSDKKMVNKGFVDIIKDKPSIEMLGRIDERLSSSISNFIKTYRYELLELIDSHPSFSKDNDKREGFLELFKKTTGLNKFDMGERSKPFEMTETITTFSDVSKLLKNYSKEINQLIPNERTR